MYPLYGTAMPPVPLRCNKTPSGKIINQNSEQSPLVRAEIQEPVSTGAVISIPFTITVASLAQPQLAIPRD